MKDLRLLFIQPDISWEDIDANLNMYKKYLKEIKPGTVDLIILPEMFNTGFSMNASLLAEQMGHKSMKFLAEIAAEKKCTVTASLIVDENSKFYNRLIWMRDDGTYELYDKRHLFRMGNEEKVYCPGKKRKLVELNGWRILPLICYDLRFPVWSRNRNDYDVIIYIANWPERRSYAWKQLLIARAIENQAYVIGVNRIGEDGNGIVHAGDSMVIDYKGEVIKSAPLNEASVNTSVLSYKDLIQFRSAFPVHLDADNFILITDEDA